MAHDRLDAELGTWAATQDAAAAVELSRRCRRLGGNGD
jgi:hypothetical protein